MRRYLISSIALLLFYSSLTAQRVTTTYKPAQQAQPTQNKQQPVTKTVPQYKPSTAFQPTNQSSAYRNTSSFAPSNSFSQHSQWGQPATTTTTKTPQSSTTNQSFFSRTVSKIAGFTNSSGVMVAETTIEDAIKIAQRDANGYSHLFQKGHDLEELIQKLGGEENTLRTVLQAANGKFPKEGDIINISVKIEGEVVELHGRMLDGIPRPSTMFIPKDIPPVE